MYIRVYILICVHLSGEGCHVRVAGRSTGYLENSDVHVYTYMYVCMYIYSINICIVYIHIYTYINQGGRRR